MKKALVVDDNDVNRILATRLLSKGGWDVAEADCGDAALTYLAGNAVELILLDVSMPGMSGQEVCRRIRDEKLGGEAVKVVAYTAHAMPEEVAELRRGGFDTVLSKPMSRDRLTATLVELGFV
ncbi:response regulator [Paramagnetospirillum kuznetsovii]|uniref:Response regulator n=1 Tax=Paramagnetospirillum kuznetsovii TaxID=2053833 RepID=A0A364P054_9PROT|nr:response regulator [Paramagnetospirillum kuznetsovii]RAU22683.1 response regulator [Paramagnetospirillum kuznetsovii]